MNPFSNNIIFWDSEFSHLNPYKGEILSAGFVKEDGEELYLELETDPQLEIDPWVKEHVIPHLTQQKIPRETAIKNILSFMGENRPYLVTFVNQYDTIYLYKLLSREIDRGMSTKEFPFQWIHIDFASMLFDRGIDPGKYSNSNRHELCRDYGIDPEKYTSHNALDDARFLREVYAKFLERN